ncbi:hypothetical protein [Pseudomonas sivasensis]|jgi:hypothetical protein|uniref:hypothetical protein n=1 Tax=Pseudomonas sivasensis TaxID=1880678 RepID=UPI003BA0F31D
MTPPLFDFDLKRISRTHYITGKAAINFPHAGSTAGGWHFLSYFDPHSGVAKVSLAGIHYPDTTDFFGDAGICDVTDQLAKLGWASEGKRLFMSDHYRAASDMIVKWALSGSRHCNVEVAEWFPTKIEKQLLLATLEMGTPRLFELGMLKQVEAWLSSQ